MYSVELYGRVRHACHVRGMSKSEAARHFEQSHPTLSGTIGRLADILAQMGI